MDIKHNLRLSFACALEAKELGDGPFGAIVIDEGGEQIGRAGNTTHSENSVTYHAEINAIQQAEYNRGAGKLNGCTIFCSAEPCPMCASAILWSGLSKVVYGVSINTMEGLGIKQIDIPCREILGKAKRPIEITGPHLEKEGTEIFNK